MKRHYPYRYQERSHFPAVHHAGQIVDAIWDEYKQDARLAEAYMKRKSGEIPWVDPTNWRGNAHSF